MNHIALSQNFCNIFQVARITKDYVQGAFWSADNQSMTENLTRAFQQNKLESDLTRTLLLSTPSTTTSAINDINKEGHEAFSTTSTLKANIITPATPTISGKNNKADNNLVETNADSENKEILPKCPETPPGLQVGDILKC